MMPERWDIRREGRAWDQDEMRERWDRLPEKMEVHQGKLLYEDEQRTNLLGVVLENVGTDRAVQLGPFAAWSASVKAHRRKHFLRDRFTRIMALMMGLNTVPLVVILWWRVPTRYHRLVDLLTAAAVSYAVALAVQVFLDD